MTAYQAGLEGGAYLYPSAGDPEPNRGAKVSLLTKGGVHTTGPWDPTFCIGWLPLPKRNREKELAAGLIPTRTIRS